MTSSLSATMQGATQAVSNIGGAISAISHAVGDVCDAVSTTREAAKVLAR